MKRIIQQLRGRRGMNVGFPIALAGIAVYLLGSVLFPSTSIALLGVIVEGVGTTIHTFGWLTQGSKKGNGEK